MKRGGLIVLLFVFLLSGCTIWHRDRGEDRVFLPMRKIDPALRGLTIDESNDPGNYSGDWLEDGDTQLI